MTDRQTKRFPDSPAAERNKVPILEVLRRTFPRNGLVLEIASGTGQHANHFAANLPSLQWQPSDPDPAALAGIEHRRQGTDLANLRPPLQLNVLEHPWPVAAFDALLCVNLLHIAPWEATTSLFRGAAAGLADRGPILIYGPFLREGMPTAAGNADFDQQLRARNERWGLREVSDVKQAAASQGFRLTELVPMPANNLCLLWHRE